MEYSFLKKITLIFSVIYLIFLRNVYFFFLKNPNLDSIISEKFSNKLSTKISKQFKKLSDYLLIVKDSLYWKSRYIYFENTKSFVSNKINSKEFFNSIYFQLLSDRAKYIDLELNVQKHMKLDLNPKFSGFSNIILEIEKLVITQFVYPPLDPELKLNEKEFYLAIQKQFIKLQKYEIY